MDYLQSTTNIKLAEHSDAAAICALLVSVFKDDPLVNYTIRDDEHRPKALKKYFDLVVKAGSADCTWITPEATGAAL